MISRPSGVITIRSGAIAPWQELGSASWKAATADTSWRIRHSAAFSSSGMPCRSAVASTSDRRTPRTRSEMTTTVEVRASSRSTARTRTNGFVAEIAQARGLLAERALEGRNGTQFVADLEDFQRFVGAADRRQALADAVFEHGRRHLARSRDCCVPCAAYRHGPWHFCTRCTACLPVEWPELHGKFRPAQRQSSLARVQARAIAAEAPPGRAGCRGANSPAKGSSSRGPAAPAAGRAGGPGSGIRGPRRVRSGRQRNRDQTGAGGRHEHAVARGVLARRERRRQLAGHRRPARAA